MNFYGIPNNPYFTYFFFDITDLLPFLFFRELLNTIIYMVINLSFLAYKEREPRDHDAIYKENVAKNTSMCLSQNWL